MPWLPEAHERITPELTLLTDVPNHRPLTIRQLRNLVQERRLTSTRQGRRVLVDLADVDDYLKHRGERRTTPADVPDHRLALEPSRPHVRLRDGEPVIILTAPREWVLAIAPDGRLEIMKTNGLNVSLQAPDDAQTDAQRQTRARICEEWARAGR